jgi:hypothetical protein
LHDTPLNLCEVARLAVRATVGRRVLRHRHT